MIDYYQIVHKVDEYKINKISQNNFKLELTK